MSRHPASTELPIPEPPEQGISRAKAHLLAEGSHWLATGEVFHDESEPMGRVLAHMDRVVPLTEHYEWLTSPHAGLAGHRPMEFIDADQLEPLEALLGRLDQQPASGNGADHEAA